MSQLSFWIIIFYSLETSQTESPQGQFKFKLHSETSQSQFTILKQAFSNNVY